MTRTKKRSYRKKGGAWLDPTTWDMFKKKPEQVIQDAPVVSEEAVGEVVEPLGATPEPSGVPGGMSSSAPAAPYLGGRRKTRKSRKTRRRN